MPDTTPKRLLTVCMLVAPFAGMILAGESGQKVVPAAMSAPTTMSAREKVRDRFLPNVNLITQDGKKVKFYDDLVKGKIVMINFMYAKCEGVCPGITANLVKVQKLLGDRVGRDIFIYSITLKPELDSPKALKEYAQMNGVKPGWTFLTGKPEDIELLRRKLGFTNPDPKLDPDKSQHIGNIRYGNEPLMLWAACPGLAHPEWIAESIHFMDATTPRQTKILWHDSTSPALH